MTETERFAVADGVIAELLAGNVTNELKRFVELPAKSSDFDPAWEKNGFLLSACQHAADWATPFFPNAVFEVLSAPGKTPALFFDIHATDKATTGTAFFYGHFDKQPEAEGWSNGRQPFVPSLEEHRLYGRGAADDGYSFYAAITAIRALDSAGIGRPRCVGLIETDEESGSRDIEYWLERVSDRIRNATVGIILDGTCCDYDRLWATVSFRGCVNLTLNVRVLEHGVHSGQASGIVPDSFMIARALLSRIEDPATGEITLPALRTTIPEERLTQLKTTAAILGESVMQEFPWFGGTRARNNSVLENLIARSSRTQLAVVGAQGLPAIADAGRVLRPETSLALSLRTPPELSAQAALESLSHELTRDPPFGAHVSVTDTSAGDGWCNRVQSNRYDEALISSSNEVFGRRPGYNCDGASIPTLSLMESFMPGAKLLVTGVLGPESNAHGPDEMLRLDYLEKLISAVARIVVRAA